MSAYFSGHKQMHGPKCTRCGGTYWTVGNAHININGGEWVKSRQCNNCNNVVEMRKRASESIMRDEPTYTQQLAINRIVSYYQNDGNDIVELKIEPTDYGTFWVTVRTVDKKFPDNIFLKDGGFFSIGKRGTIKVASLYRIRGKSSAEKEWEAAVSRAIESLSPSRDY